MSHGYGVLITNGSLMRHGKHGSMIQEILKSNNGLQNRSEIFRRGESEASDTANGVDIESNTSFSELKPGHLATGKASNELLVYITERDLRGPGPINGGLHGYRIEDEEKHFGFFGAEAEREGVPSLVGEDGEVSGQVSGGGREGKKLIVVMAVFRVGWVREEFEELEGPGSPDGEGFDDELAAESEALDVGAGLEGEIGGGFRGLVVGVLVLLLLVLAFGLLFLFHGGGEDGGRLR